MKKTVLYILLLILYLLHNDLWFWNDARLIGGFPIGLLYHIGFCLAASLVMFALVRYAWPEHLEVEDAEGERP